jgi:spermidine/putrescine transport system permease protein
MWNYGAALALIMLVIIGITTLFNDDDEHAGKAEGGLI